MPRTKHCAKSYTPTPVSDMSIEPDTLDESIDPTTDRQNPDTAPVMSDELFNPKSVLQSAKTIQEAALVELQQQMNDLTTSFSDRAVAIVEEGMRNCFFVASSRIRQIQLPDWIMSDGETLEGVVSPISLPGSTTDGVIE
jgi:hypothetical protein